MSKWATTNLSNLAGYLRSTNHHWDVQAFQNEPDDLFIAKHFELNITTYFFMKYGIHVQFVVKHSTLTSSSSSSFFLYFFFFWKSKCNEIVPYCPLLSSYINVLIFCANTVLWRYLKITLNTVCKEYFKVYMLNSFLFHCNPTWFPASAALQWLGTFSSQPSIDNVNAQNSLLCLNYAFRMSWIIHILIPYRA